MTEEKPTRAGDTLVMLVILVRVVVILLIWLGVFVAAFLGYFTVPLVLIGFVAVMYMLSDLGLFLVFRRRNKGISQRQLFLSSFKKRSTKDG